MSNNQANTNSVSNRIKHSVFKSSTSSKSKSNNTANSNGNLTASASMEINALNKNSLIDSNDNGGFPIGASSLSTNNSVKPSAKQSTNLSHVNSINHASSSLKSSVKRLFSPISHKNATSNNITNHITNNQIASLPSGADANIQPSSTPLMSSKKHQNSMRQQAPLANQMQQQSNPSRSFEKSLEASLFSAKSDHLSTSTSSATSTLSTSTSGPNMTTSNTSSLYMSVKSTNQDCNGKTALKKKDNDMNKSDSSNHFAHSDNGKQGNNSTNGTSRHTPTSSLKKHLNILKNNSKKVLLGNSHNTNNNNTNQNDGSSSKTCNNKQQPLSKSTMGGSSTCTTSKPNNGDNNKSNTLKQSPTAIVSTSTALSTSPSTNIPFSKLQEYEMKINELKNEINTSHQSSNEYKHEIKDLQMEIERLSHLYNFELNKQTKYEEKMMSLKQTAEEKQIESAAIKYEFRKVQELKDNLAAENAYLKTLINNNNGQQSAQKLATTNSLMTTSLNNNVSSSPKSTFNSPRLVNLNYNNAVVSSTSSLCSIGSTPLMNTSLSNLNNNMANTSLQVQGGETLERLNQLKFQIDD